MSSDPMLIVQNASLRMEVKDLTKQISQLTSELTDLKTIMYVCDLTKIYNELAPRSIYRGIFTGSYRTVILHELIARYQFTGVGGAVDRAVVIRILNSMGREALGEGLITYTGDKIELSGG
jgi:hypothetical protein